MPSVVLQKTPGLPKKESLTIATLPPLNDVHELRRIALTALRMQPPRYVRSIIGPTRSWLPPHRQFSEYNIINPWQFAKTGRYLTEITVPAMARTAPDWARTVFPPVVNRLFWRPTSYFLQPDNYDGVCSFPNEHWFFINGVATNEDVARINSSFLANLFFRPVSVIQNATDSLLVDLYECALGKEFLDNPDPQDPKSMTEPGLRAFYAILDAINAPHKKKVIVIAHSQGTIIMANVLRALTRALTLTETMDGWHPIARKLMGSIATETDKILRDKLAHSLSVLTRDGPNMTFERLAKLEIYTFANCADQMRYVYPEQQIPYMEHFANEFDVVARLGVLSPLRDPSRPGPIAIDGPLFVQDCAWGHLLNEHYLSAIDDFLYPGSCNHRRKSNPYSRPDDGELLPRLYDYFHGNRPGDHETGHLKKRK